LDVDIRAKARMAMTATTMATLMAPFVRAGPQLLPRPDECYGIGSLELI
jgi:hypothetical protein